MNYQGFTMLSVLVYFVFLRLGFGEIFSFAAAFIVATVCLLPLLKNVECGNTEMLKIENNSAV